MRSEGNKRTKLFFTTCEGKTVAGVELSFPGNFELLCENNLFIEKIWSLAGVPEHHELGRFLAVAQREQMPSIRRRASPSQLETNAAALLTALAFSSSEQWADLVRDFLEAHGLVRKTRGRPTLYLKDGSDFVRGTQIDAAAARLDAGFQLRSQAKAIGGFSSDDQEIATALEEKGYDRREIEALQASSTLQDAACRYYLATQGKQLNIGLKAVRNSYARYKRLVACTKPA